MRAIHRRGAGMRSGCRKPRHAQTDIPIVNVTGGQISRRVRELAARCSRGFRRGATNGGAPVARTAGNAAVVRRK